MCKKSVEDMVEQINYLEVEGEKISISLKSGDFYQYVMNEPLKEKYSEILGILALMDRDKVKGILDDIKDVLDALDRGELCKLDLREHIDRLKKAVSNLEDEQDFSRAEIGEIWTKIHELEKEGRDKEIFLEEEVEEDKGLFAGGPLFTIENFSLHEVNLFQTLMVLSYSINKVLFKDSIFYSESEKLVGDIRALTSILTGLIRNIFPRVLDNRESHCYMCGHCCSRFIVEVEPSDIKRLAEHFEMTEKRF